MKNQMTIDMNLGNSDGIEAVLGIVRSQAKPSELIVRLVHEACFPNVCVPVAGLLHGLRERGCVISLASEEQAITVSQITAFLQ